MRFSLVRSYYRLEGRSLPRQVSSMTRNRHWRAKDRTPREKAARAVAYTEKMKEKVDYSAWSNEKLIERVTQLENELRNQNLRFGKCTRICRSMTN